jgi:hypothetical protein
MSRTRFAVPNQVAKSLSAVRLPVTTKRTPPKPPAKKVAVPTSTVPPATTTTGIEPSVQTTVSAATDIPPAGAPVTPTTQNNVPTSGVIVPTTPNGINPSVGRSPESGAFGGGGRFEFQEFTALVF